MTTARMAALGVLWALTLTGAPTAHQPDEPGGGLESILEPIRAAHGLPALAAAVIRDGELSEVAAVGVRQAGDGTPVSAEDLFHIGSCTKAMTATLIAVLVEDGLLRWDSTIGEVLGQTMPRMDGAWKGVTIDQLLTHTAGVPSNLNAAGLWSRLWKAAETKTPPEQRRVLLEGVLTGPPVHAPGTKFLYANAGYAIAGAMAEQVTGEAWEDLMRARLFGPLAMESAGFGAPGSPEVIDQPRGHTRDGKPVEPGLRADNPAAIGPGGTVHCSLEDWAGFVALHLRGARANLPVGAEAGPLLGAESFRHMHAAPPGRHYACGWTCTTRPWARGEFDGAEGRVLTHSGSNTMWFAVVWAAPERNFAVLVATNSGVEGAPKACDEAAAAVLKETLAP